jgi:uncharacterized membrane protein YeaQ/YmgE (transglycosylase-associated protein family)
MFAHLSASIMTSMYRAEGERLPSHARDPEEVDMVGALLLGFVCGVIARVLMPGDAFRNMSGPASWAVSVGLGLVGALVGYVIFTLGLGIGDTDIFDWGGLLSALIGTVIVVGLASYFLRRRQPRPTPSTSLPQTQAPPSTSPPQTQGPPSASPPQGQGPPADG